MRKILFVIATALLTSAVVAFSATDERRDSFGATVRVITPEYPSIHLIFTADSMFEGAPEALDAMARRGVKASFFLTGNYLRDSAAHAPVIERILADCHYLGPHGDRHILIADWNRERSTLASPDSALADMKANIALLADFGVDTSRVKTIVPSFEWYNADHIAAFRASGLRPVSPTPGVETYRDYTLPDDPYYLSSDALMRQLLDYSDPVNAANPHPLDGFIILFHLGTQDERTDKLYHRLPAILDTLTSRGYRFTAL